MFLDLIVPFGSKFWKGPNVTVHLVENIEYVDLFENACVLYGGFQFC